MRELYLSENNCTGNISANTRLHQLHWVNRRWELLLLCIICYYKFNQCTHHATLATSVGAICFEDRFCARKKGGIEGGGWVSARGAAHMAAALSGCIKALVGTGLGISLLFDINRHR